MILTDFMTNIYAGYISVLSTVLPTFLAGSTTTVTDFGYKYIGAGVAVVGVLGAGIGQGQAAAGACMAIGRNPEAAGKITTTMVIGAGIAESGAIYALLISILILFAI